MNKNYVETTNVQVQTVKRIVIILTLNGVEVSTYTLDRIDVDSRMKGTCLESTAYLWLNGNLIGRMNSNAFKHNLRFWFSDLESSLKTIVRFYSLELNTNK